MMTCCKEKAVLLAVYNENPKKRRVITTKSHNIKHHHHEHHLHHHHHLHVHQSKNHKGNRRAELLSYSQHLRESSKLKPSTPPRPPKSLTPSTTSSHQTITQVHGVENKQKLKKQSSVLDMKSIFKCFAMSNAKRKMKRKRKKKKNSGESASKKASVIMKRFNARTQNFFSKLKATIQKYR